MRARPDPCLRTRELPHLVRSAVSLSLAVHLELASAGEWQGESAVVTLEGVVGHVDAGVLSQRLDSETESHVSMEDGTSRRTKWWILPDAELFADEAGEGRVLGHLRRCT